MITFHFRASRFEPDVGQDSDEERVLRKKALQVCCMSCKVLYFACPFFFVFLIFFCRSAERNAARKSKPLPFGVKL
jgi:hypothetical protein